jgi:uncharacterized protein (TIGR03437 family)
MRHYASKSIAVTHKFFGPVAPFRHRPWRALSQLSIFAVLTNVLCAANAPTFSYFASGPGSVNVIASDSAANTYIAGAAQPAAIAATPGAFQSQDNSSGYCGVVPMVGALFPCIGSFVEKLEPTGAVIFATYFSGNGNTTISGIAVDRQGNVYVAGVTSAPFGSANTFPLTPGAAFTNPSAGNLGELGPGAGFIAKLNPSGSQLVYSTLIPGAYITALAVDPEGNAYITGSGSGSSFPATAGAFQVSPKASASPGIVAKLNASGSALVYATYLSGSGGQVGEGEIPDSIAVDANGDAFIAGFTYSPDFPVTAGAFLTTNPGGRAMFLTKLNPQGSSLVYSTWIGQTNGYGTVVKLDAQGTAFVAGSTLSGSSTVSGFLDRFSADGSALIYSTRLPSGFGSPALDVDTAGNTVIAVTTSDADLPVGAGAFQPEYVSGATSNVYVARFTPSGQLSGATYLGGSQQDAGSAIALRPNGSVVVSGFTQSPDFPGRQLVPQAGGSYTTSIFISLTALNAASYVPTGVVPGEIVSLFGYGIGPATGVSATGSVLPDELAGVQVSFNGLAAPLFYVQSGQINAQVPWELAGQTSATLQIAYPGVAATGTPVVVTPSLPGVFSIVNADGSINSPSNPARPGDYVSVYGTGGGAMSPPGVTGNLWPLAPLSLLPPPVSATVGGEGAGVLYSGSAPTLESGLFQINVRLPSDLTTGVQVLLVTVSGVTGAPAAISIQ